MRTGLFALVIIGPLILAPAQLARAVGANLAIIIRNKFGTIALTAAKTRRKQFALKDVLKKGEPI